MSLYNYIDKYLLLPMADILYGSSLSAQLKVLKGSEFNDENEILASQNKKLQSLVKHCYETVPYYQRVFKSLGLTPSDIQTREDLQKLPILTKQIIRDNYDDFFSTAVPPKYRRHASTGGSTGTPLIFCTDKREWSLQRASTIRAWENYGLHLGDKIFSLAGSALTKKGRRLSSKNLYDTVIVRNHKYGCADIDDAHLAIILNEFKRVRPKAIRGYGSSLLILARYMKRVGYHPDTVKLILTTGEILLPNYRKELESFFNAPLFDAYGAGDGGIVSHECQNHHLHITEELCIIEITNKEGKVLPAGEVGYVTSTDLENYVFPFLRYQVGDMSYIRNEQCSCGRHTLQFGEVMGRAGRLIFNKQGIPISPTVLPMLLYPDKDYHKLENQVLYNKIDRFQIRQDKKGDIQVLLKMKEKVDEDLDRYSFIVTNFRNHFQGSNVTLSFVDEIPVLPSGKEDYCVSEFEYDGF